MDQGRWSLGEWKHILGSLDLGQHAEMGLLKKNMTRKTRYSIIWRLGNNMNILFYKKYNELRMGPKTSNTEKTTQFTQL